MTNRIKTCYILVNRPFSQALYAEAKLILFYNISPACISTFRAENESSKAFFAVACSVLVGDFFAKAIKKYLGISRDNNEIKSRG
jgi:hypothetical protein